MELQFQGIFPRKAVHLGSLRKPFILGRTLPRGKPFTIEFPLLPREPTLGKAFPLGIQLEFQLCRGMNDWDFSLNIYTSFCG